ncbi:hypothetical protein B0H11DRAFT_2073259 [Mycena galericulata]|nr:hypothetical protein B0H11DRAFT_2073259 [Mycena galericulata]
MAHYVSCSTLTLTVGLSAGGVCASAANLHTLTTPSGICPLAQRDLKNISPIVAPPLAADLPAAQTEPVPSLRVDKGVLPIQHPGWTPEQTAITPAHPSLPPTHPPHPDHPLLRSPLHPFLRRPLCPHRPHYPPRFLPWSPALRRNP